MNKPFQTTVTGSYPRPVQPRDTLRKPELKRSIEVVKAFCEDRIIWENNHPKIEVEIGN